MRYVGQAFELAVPFSETLRSMDAIEMAFREVYDRRYAHATDDPPEIVSFRLSAYGIVTKPRLPRQGVEEGRGSAADVRARGGLGGHFGAPHVRQAGHVGAPHVRQTAFNARFESTPVFARERLPIDAVVSGPALVEEAGTTTVVPPGFRAWPDRHDDLVLEVT